MDFSGRDGQENPLLWKCRNGYASLGFNGRLMNKLPQEGKERISGDIWRVIDINYQLIVIGLPGALDATGECGGIPQEGVNQRLEFRPIIL
jgi:hypothetical protein